MKIVINKYLPFKGFMAINLFGILFVRENAYSRFFDNRKRVLNHEMIHTAQMKELLYVFFYILYGLNWLFNIFRYKFDNKKAYRNIVFEQEAYIFEDCSNYLDLRDHFYWLQFVKKH